MAEFAVKGVSEDVARATVLAHLSMPARDHRSARERDIKEVEKDLMAQGVPPGIARAAAEGRVVEEPPQVKRATAAREARERELE